MKTAPTLETMLFLCCLACGQGADPLREGRTSLPPLGGPLDTPSNPLPRPTQDAPPPPPVVQATSLAPISGGTLGVSSGLALISDPDLDRLLFFDLAARTFLPEIALSPGDQPGRWVVHGRFATVVLRGAGQVLTTSLDAPQQFVRRKVCAEPRGIDHDPARAALFVVCARGEIMRLPAQDYGEAALVMQLEPDLRDIVVTRAGVLVSRFRSADITVLAPGAQGLIARFPIGGTPERAASATKKPHVAWQMVRADDDTALVVTQSINTIQASDGWTVPSLGLAPITPEVALVDVHGSTDPVSIGQEVLPVGVALSAGLGVVAVAAAGSGHRVAVNHSALKGEEPPTVQSVSIAGMPVAVAFDARDRLLTVTRSPGQLLVDGSAFPFPGTAQPEDTGHQIFHQDAGRGLACASCHPEGGDDGALWNFVVAGLRRTQSLAGGLRGTEPFHWSGDMGTFHEISHEVFTVRMGGRDLRDDEEDSLLSWIDKLPPARPAIPLDPTLAAQGKEVFDRLCVRCHAGTRLGREQRQSVDVGTGEPLQVPGLLGIALRAPYMHNGCAATLRERFDNPSCGGGSAHVALGNARDVDALIQYLESL